MTHSSSYTSLARVGTAMGEVLVVAIPYKSRILTKSLNDNLASYGKIPRIFRLFGHYNGYISHYRTGTMEVDSRSGGEWLGVEFSFMLTLFNTRLINCRSFVTKCTPLLNW